MNSPTVLITGATGGIGQAVTHALTPTHSLVLAGRDPQRLESLCASAAGSARPWLVDLTDPDDVERAVGSLPELDAIVHCAGSYDRGLIPALPMHVWQQAFQLNLFSAVRITQAALPALRRARGTVVIINSGAGLFTYATGAIYSATKHAMRAFADTLRIEEQDNGVRVTSIHPGRVGTGMLRDSIDAFEHGDYAAERYLTPDDVAALVVTAVTLRPGATLDDIRIKPLAADGLRR